MAKREARIRRSKKTRIHIRSLNMLRLSVHRTNKHIYAQVFDETGAKVLASASTLESEVRAVCGNGGNLAAATIVGKRIAEKAIAVGATRVAFDRSGFSYHGRVKALADAAREAGLVF